MKISRRATGYPIWPCRVVETKPLVAHDSCRRARRQYAFEPCDSLGVKLESERLTSPLGTELNGYCLAAAADAQLTS